MKMRCAAIVLVCIGAASLAGAEEYRWPLNSARKLSSSFGEFREGHYHAGVDLRTFGQIGLPCLAIGEGDVVRLRVSPKGYGKAVYLRLKDGRLAIYAHLNGFSRRLDSLSYYWRLEHGRSSFDIEIEPGAYRFRAGDTISYTGATGSPQPHLHFEMRDSSGMPFNPLESAYRIPDACLPVISALEVIPLSWGSLVNGSPVAFSKHLRLAKGGRYVLDDTLRCDGTFGFGVSAYDKQVRGSYRMAPYSAELLIDGKQAYRLRNSRFDYSQVGDIALEYEERGGGAPGRYVLLFKKPGNVLPGRDGIGVVTNVSSRTGALALGSGVHRAEIIIEDANGNEASSVFHFSMRSYPVVETFRSGSDSSRIEIIASDSDGGAVSTSLSASLDGGRTWSSIALAPASKHLKGNVLSSGEALYRCVARGEEGTRVERFFSYARPRGGGDSVLCECRAELRAEGLYLRLKADRPLASIPSVRRAGGSSGDSLGVFQVGLREYIAFEPVERLVSGVNLFSIRGMDFHGFPLNRVHAYQMFVLESGTGASFNASDSFAIQLRAPSVRGRAAVLVRETGRPGSAAPGLVQLAPPFVLDYPVEGFSRPFLCGFDGGAQAGLFRWNGKREGWRCVGVPAREGGMVEMRRPGIYAVFADKKAPELKALSFTRRNPGSGFFKKKLYYVPVHERGSGVDSESAVAVLNGARVVCEWDEYRSRLALPIPRTCRRGPAKLRIELSDQAGNRTAGEYVFVIE